MSEAAHAYARRLTLALLALLPLIVLPGLPQPFSTPKFYAIFGTVAVLIPLNSLARFMRRVGDPSDMTPPRRVRKRIASLAICWILGWILSTVLGDPTLSHRLAVALAFITAMFAMQVVDAEPDPTQLVTAMVVGATGLAIVALSQTVGIDPFALAGWAPPIGQASARLRVYGTLGNPNFVAAVLAATTPLTFSLLARLETRRGPTFQALVAVLMLQVAGVIVTGSRGGALGLVAAAIAWAALAPGDRRRRITVAALGGAIALIAIILSTARPLDQTMAGRAYIVGVAWPHAFDAPWVGRGPGAFEELYPEWEQAARQGQRGRPPFAGPQQHAHNDYLEALIERGLFGLVTILAILATCLRHAWRSARRTQDASIVIGAAAMLTALAAIACVDFPLARPTELTWWWTGVALITLSTGGDSDGTLDDVDNGAHLGPDGPHDRAGPRHDRRDRSRGQDEVLGKT